MDESIIETIPQHIWKEHILCHVGVSDKKNMTQVSKYMRHMIATYKDYIACFSNEIAATCYLISGEIFLKSLTMFENVSVRFSKMEAWYAFAKFILCVDMKKLPIKTLKLELWNLSPDGEEPKAPCLLESVIVNWSSILPERLEGLYILSYPPLAFRNSQIFPDTLTKLFLHSDMPETHLYGPKDITATQHTKSYCYDWMLFKHLPKNIAELVVLHMVDLSEEDASKISEQASNACLLLKNLHIFVNPTDRNGLKSLQLFSNLRNLTLKLDIADSSDDMDIDKQNGYVYTSNHKEYALENITNYLPKNLECLQIYLCHNNVTKSIVHFPDTCNVSFPSGIKKLDIEIAYLSYSFIKSLPPRLETLTLFLTNEGFKETESIKNIPCTVETLYVYYTHTDLRSHKELDTIILNVPMTVSRMSMFYEGKLFSMHPIEWIALSKEDSVLNMERAFMRQHNISSTCTSNLMVFPLYFATLSFKPRTFEYMLKLSRDEKSMKSLGINPLWVDVCYLQEYNRITEHYIEKTFLSILTKAISHGMFDDHLLEMFLLAHTIK